MHAQVDDLQTEQEQAQENHSWEVLQKNEYTDTLQKQVQQVHAQVVHMHAAQEQTQEKYSREVFQKNEDLDAQQTQLRQVHAYVADLQTAQEQAQQNHSREVLLKNEDIAALQKQLQQVRDELEAGGTRFEQAMEVQSRKAEETIRRQQQAIDDLKAQVAAYMQAPISEPISEPTSEPLAEPIAELVSKPLSHRHVPQPIILNSRAASLSGSSVVSPAASRQSVRMSASGASVASDFRIQNHDLLPPVAQPCHSAPVLVTRIAADAGSFKWPHAAMSPPPVSEPAATSSCRSPAASYSARSPISSALTFHIPNSAKVEH